MVFIDDYIKDKCYQCQFCGQQFELSSLLLCHSLEFHRSGPDRQKISTIINSFLQNQEETIYSSDSDCDYQIVTTIRRVAKVKPENSIESDDEPIIKLAQHRLSLKTSDKFVDAIKQEEQEDTGIINDVFIATGNYLEQEPFDYKHPCDFCERKFLTKLAVNKHCKNEHRSIVDIKADDSDDNHFNGREDSYESESKENILTKKPNKKLGAKNSFTCDCCQKKFSTFRKIQIHIKKNHAVINDVDSGNSLDESENADESVNFSTEFEMQSDEDFRRTRKNTGYSCPICSNIFSSKGTLSKHFLKLHKKDGLSLTDNLSLLKQNRGIGFSCALCPKTYDCRTALYRHLLVKHKLNKKDRVVTAKTWTCEICKKSFFRVKCFVKHKALHSNQLEKVPKKRLLKRDKKFLCSFCGKKYQTSNHLKIHLRIHTGERPYTCSFCAKNFTIKKTWQDHENSHTGEKPYGCPIDTCGKFFTHASGVRQHMLSVHTPEKRFQCEHCDKRFSKKTHLLDHIRSHTGERPFECKYCGIKFRLTSTLRIHNRTHTGERPFKCEICNKGFIKSYGLKQHLRSKRNCTPQQQPPQNIQLEQQPAMISQQLPPLVPITINNSTAIGHNVQNSNPNNSIIITNPENSMVISIMHQLQ